MVSCASSEEADLEGALPPRARGGPHLVEALDSESQPPHEEDAILEQGKGVWQRVRDQAWRVAGIDRAVSASILARLWGLFAFPITLWLIARHFTKEEQGDYYTLMHVLNVQALLEVGFSAVLVQFISHEWSRLESDGQGGFRGDARAAGRLASLTRLGARWYTVLALVFVLGVGSAERWFVQAGSPPGMRGAWWAVCLAVGLNMGLIPLRSFLEGTGRMGQSQVVALCINMGAGISGWLALNQGLGLYTPAVISMACFCIGLVCMGRTLGEYRRAMIRLDENHTVSWQHEFWPQQWRIGISWFCGYFMFGSFVPLLDLTGQRIAAGQMGATMVLYNAVSALCSSWTQAVGPQFGVLGASGRYDELKALVRTTYWRSLVACVLFSGAALGSLALLQSWGIPWALRFADLGSISLLLLGLLALQLPTVETLAVRFQKKEPFMLNSLASAGLVVASNLLLGHYFGARGVCAGFALVMCTVTVPGSHVIYMRHLGRISGPRAEAEPAQAQAP